MRGQINPRKAIPLGFIMVIGFAALSSAGWAQERGACVAADVPEAFRLPDGSLHPAGRLTLCTVEAFTPVAGLHRVWAEGGSATLVMSRRGEPEATTDRPEVLFRRTPDGPLELVGYVLSTGRKSWSYALQRPARRPSIEASQATAPAAQGDLVTLLATNAN